MKTVEFVIFLLAMIFYIRHILLHKEFTPNPVTFGIWFLAETANVITYLDFSDRWVAPIITFIGAIVIFCLSLYRNLQKKTKLKIFDWFCIVASLTSLIFYFVTGESENANIIVQIILVIGFFPIIKDLLTTKAIEPLLTWALFSIGWLLTTILTYNNPNHTLIELTYPLIQGVIGCSIVLLISSFKLLRIWLKSRKSKKRRLIGGCFFLF